MSKNFFTVFGHFTQKAFKNLGKTYLGHVPINRSTSNEQPFFATKGHYMWNKYTNVQKAWHFSYLMYQNNKTFKKKVDMHN